jgi:hypothetical protein
MVDKTHKGKVGSARLKLLDIPIVHAAITAVCKSAPYLGQDYAEYEQDWNDERVANGLQTQIPYIVVSHVSNLRLRMFGKLKPREPEEVVLKQRERRAARLRKKVEYDPPMPLVPAVTLAEIEELMDKKFSGVAEFEQLLTRRFDEFLAKIIAHIG